jgi:RimJ/RimL family protein N-acetyltransferase
MDRRNFILETNKVLLRPLQESDYHHFLQLSQDEQMWQYFTLNLQDENQLSKWMNIAKQDRELGTRIPFTIINKETNTIAGSTSIGNISDFDLRAEIGWSWLGKPYRSSGVNRHAKFSMLKYIFEEWKFERVEFKTDVLNERAKKGLKNVGVKEEGVLRSHMTMWNNRRRSSVFYSILKDEWPEVKQSFFKDLDQ